MKEESFIPQASIENKNREQIRSGELFDVSQFINAGRIKERYDYGQQLEILKDGLDVDWLFQKKGFADEEMEQWYGVFKKNGKIFFLEGCSGSDPGYSNFDGENPSEWLKDNLKDVYIFNNLQDLTDWIQEKRIFISSPDIGYELINSLSAN